MDNAHLFFPHEEDDDLFDVYEERLFAEKQFFTSRVILPSVFEKRFEKIRKMEDAFRFLTQTDAPVSTFKKIPKKEPKTVTEAYQGFQSTKAILFQKIFQAEDSTSLIDAVHFLIEAFTEYTAHWQITKDFSSEGILISKEPDPTALSKAILSFTLAGGSTLKDLQLLTYPEKETLLNEAKRLSLWRKKEYANGNF